MAQREEHIVIGGGIAGCLSAILRARAGYKVTLIERETAKSPGAYPVCTQTSNIVSENHSGAEYPFDAQSARDCLDGRIENEKFFPELIYGGKTYSRIIASQSMMDDGYDIVKRCRENMSVIQSHYAARCTQDVSNAVFGDPAEICREIPGVDGVNDVARAFITPQRGMNPVFVASLLESELKRCGVEFKQGCSAERIERLESGRYLVEVKDNFENVETHIVDQLSLCAASHSFGIAKKLNPQLSFPKIFMALRNILYVDLPKGTDKNFTCLKLEDSYGGMFSPFNKKCAMIYHPPAAHIENHEMDTIGGHYPESYKHYLKSGHPELGRRTARTLMRLREFYPDLAESQVLGSYLKVAINTVTDSRMRRNMGVFEVQPGCTMSVLPKWTMCVVNAKKEVSSALAHSVAVGRMSKSEAKNLNYLLEHASLQSPLEWQLDPMLSLAQVAERHAMNMGVPRALALIMKSPSFKKSAQKFKGVQI